MSESLYKPLIQNMTWSYSRIKAFEDCPYRWYLKYIREREDDHRFYASYGSFIHKLLEGYYKGELPKDDMLIEYYRNFQTEVHGFRPKEPTLSRYIESGADYLSNFEPFPFKTLAVEHEVRFEMGGRNFLGYVDYIGQDEDGEICIVDNKSGDFKPPSGKEQPTLSDLKLADALKQLYLYAVPIEQQYGRLPAYLCLNCFRFQRFIKVPFDTEVFEKTKRWALDTIDRIEDADVFPPKVDGFSCFWICGVSKHCKYDIATTQERRAEKRGREGHKQSR